MGLRDKLRRAEQRASEHFTVVRCSECGKEVRCTGDVALKVLAASWSRARGAEYETYSAVERILDHEHPALAEALFPKVATGA